MFIGPGRQESASAGANLEGHAGRLGLFNPLAQAAAFPAVTSSAPRLRLNVPGQSPIRPGSTPHEAEDGVDEIAAVTITAAFQGCLRSSELLAEAFEAVPAPPLVGLDMG